MKHNIIKKILAFEIISLLIILSIAPALNSEYNIDIKEEQLSDEEKNILKENFKKNDNKKLDNHGCCQQENNIDFLGEEYSNLNEMMYSDFHSLISDHESFKEVSTIFSAKTCALIENTTVRGYITDNETDEPIEDAHIIILWEYNQDLIGNYTYSNSLGFYEINLEVESIYIIVRANGYFTETKLINDVNENEIVWINVTLNPGAPLKNSIVCGYITDESTDNPIENANVHLLQFDQVSFDWNYARTDAFGFYNMSIPAGAFYVIIYADGYFNDYFYSDTINEYETIKINFALTPIPLEHSIIQGYITDNNSGDPIKDALVKISWSDGHENQYSNSTLSDSSGYYQINVAAGENYLSVEKDGYYKEYMGNTIINENETIQIDVVLFPCLPENSIVHGFIIDNNTGNPIENASLNLYWNDNQGHYEGNDTYTDSSGYYRMDVAAGEIDLYARQSEYYSKYLRDINIGESETLEINIALDPPPAENSIINGYITDSSTGYPIENAYVDFNWKDNHGHYSGNFTYTDSSGYYKMNVAAGEIDLYISADGYYGENIYDYTINESETIQINFALTPKPPENSIIQGYITSEKTGYPIKGAYVDLDWWDNTGRYGGNFTYTDSSGYYKMNVAAGEIDLYISADGYFSEFTDDYTVSENETLQINVYLMTKPPENSVIVGYITDNNTGDPIENAFVSLDWRDNQGYYDWNSTYTDSSGYYKMNVAAGEIDLYIKADGYYRENTDDYSIGENEILEVNISLITLLPENSIIQGYITDVNSGIPIEGAYIYVSWRDNLGYTDRNSTHTDSSGYYKMNVAAGEIDLYISAVGYFSENTDDYLINENETLNVNIALSPHPVESSLIHGFITDKNTGNPIEHVYVSLSWKDNLGHRAWNSTYTDSFGYYTINVAAGEVDLNFINDEYYRESTNDFTIDEYESIEINFTLTPFLPENSVIKGYITDKNTGYPIEEADVSLFCWNSLDYYDWNSTYTDSFGYYEINSAAGEIDLSVEKDGYYDEYSDYYTISENETKQINIALTPHLPENSRIYGYITDENTGNPIENVYIGLDWHDNLGHYNDNYTYTDSSGYYNMNVATGEISLSARKDGYYDEHIGYQEIDEFETIPINIILTPCLPENSIIQGYITDKTTGDPLEKVFIDCDWEDSKGHSIWNHTYTDALGYFQIHVAAGEIKLYISEDGYRRKYTDDYSVNENEVLWINASLKRERPWVSIIKPRKALYMDNNKVLHLFIITIIVGDIEFEAFASDGVSHVEFYLDRTLQKTDYDYPFTWMWDDQTFFKHRHRIKVIAYDIFGNTATDRTTVWKFK